MMDMDVIIIIIFNQHHHHHNDHPHHNDHVDGQVVRGEGRREEVECPVCTEEMIPPKRIFQVFPFLVCLIVCLFVYSN